ncbi:P1 family peptidase [Calidifontibacter indicus]|uniref:P1 family peptidase n=1 Tax=Calidifontibacter indicus TaxID=419650 RepID=UPI003D713932
MIQRDQQTAAPFETPAETGRISDVPGVRVGHTTVVDGDVRTGVTTVVPDPVPSPARPLRCGLFVGNGHGKLVGATELIELGELQTPLVLTNTLSTFLAADALTDWMLRRPECADVVTLNPLVAECNDSWLSDIRARAVHPEHVHAALDGADTDFACGAVGAGTGMRALGFKGGIGTASRRVGDHTVGVLALTNFSGTLSVGGTVVESPDTVVPEGNSCIMVVATDAPLDARQLGRVARRSVFAMGTVGADYRHGSGDYGIAFSTDRHSAPLTDRRLDPYFRATLDASADAIVSSLWHAPTTIGRTGHTAHGLQDVLRARGLLS